MKFDNGRDVIFHVQNVIEHRFSWNKCFIICKTNAACRNHSQVVRLNMRLLQHLSLLQSRCNVTSSGT